MSGTLTYDFLKEHKDEYAAEIQKALKTKGIDCNVVVGISVGPKLAIRVQNSSKSASETEEAFKQSMLMLKAMSSPLASIPIDFAVLGPVVFQRDENMRTVVSKFRIGWSWGILCEIFAGIGVSFLVFSHTHDVIQSIGSLLIFMAISAFVNFLVWYNEIREK